MVGDQVGLDKAEAAHRPQNTEAQGALRKKDPTLPSPPTKDCGMSQPGKLSQAKCKQLLKE